jgi:phosphatidylglycerol:prolipoprotein diacylglycerol transferase
VLFTIGDVEVPSYAAALALAFVVAAVVRSVEKRRTGWAHDPNARLIGMAALIGAAVGAKLGMVFFEPWDDFTATLQRALSFDFTGKTVIGGIIGGYAAIELMKKMLGVTRSTGDSFALALPLAQAIGRVGCFFHGCCYGAPSDVAWAVEMHGALRHPAQLYEAGLDLALFFVILAVRHRPRPEGNLFRGYLVGYASIRFFMDFLRGDPVAEVGPLSVVQVLCLVVIVFFSAWILRLRKQAEREGEEQADVEVEADVGGG